MVATPDPDPLAASARRAAAAAGLAMPDGSFPVRDHQELVRAIRSVGRARHDDPTAVRRFIIQRAKELQAETEIPKSWNADGTESP